MRINIRLTGIIFGIIFLASIGRILFNMGFYSGAGRRRNDKNNSGGIIIILGLGLLLIGWIGGFFGSIIRASISRQREFLADASAVQFTRNPDGIAGALKRIGGYKEGSKINSAGAQEFSHMFFCSGISSLFSTHPHSQFESSALNQTGIINIRKQIRYPIIFLLHQIQIIFLDLLIQFKMTLQILITKKETSPSLPHPQPVHSSKQKAK